jgi:hypothetical protein
LMRVLLRGLLSRLSIGIVAFSLAQDLLLFIRHNSMSLTVKSFSFLYEDFFTDFRMFGISLRIKGPTTAWALIQVNVMGFGKSFWWQLLSKTFTFLSDCRDYLLCDFIFIILISRITTTLFNL